jgi:hypothetical protein
MHCRRISMAKLSDLPSTENRDSDRMTGKPEIEVQPSPTVPLRPHNSACNVKSRLSHIIMMLPRRRKIMLVRYFRRPSRIEVLLLKALVCPDSSRAWLRDPRQ